MWNHRSIAAVSADFRGDSNVYLSYLWYLKLGD